MLGQAERKWPAYAGFPPDSLFAALRAALRRPDPVANVQVLRCICGDPQCSWATVRVESGPDEVVWRDVEGSGADVASRESAYAALGPYRFSRQAYESALAEPTHAVSPPSR